MILESFRVTNYRSINDSGLIKVTKRTALVGRNESGKSNLLLALASLNPQGGIKPLNEVKDFPRDRPLTDFKPTLTVLNTTWKLTEAERAELRKVYPRAASIERVTVSRDYKGLRYVGLGLESIEVDAEALREGVEQLRRSASAAFNTLPEDVRPQAKAALETFDLQVKSQMDGDPEDWAREAKAAVANLRSTMNSISFTLPAAAAAQLQEIEARIVEIEQDEALSGAARKWVVEHLPRMIYVSDYPELDGHQNLPEYLNRKNNGGRKPADLEFDKLMKVAGLDPADPEPAARIGPRTPTTACEPRRRRCYQEPACAMD